MEGAKEKGIPLSQGGSSAGVVVSSTAHSPMGGGTRLPRGRRFMICLVLGQVRSAQDPGDEPVTRADLGLLRWTGSRQGLVGVLKEAVSVRLYCRICDDRRLHHRGVCEAKHPYLQCHGCRSKQFRFPNGRCVNEARHPLLQMCEACGRRTRRAVGGGCINAKWHARPQWCGSCQARTLHDSDGHCLCKGHFVKK